LDLADLVAENITGSVDVSGLGAGKHTVSVTLDLADLVAENITGSVDVSGLGAGKHTVSVTLDLDSGISATAATTNITITTE
jgi:YbbR domain-containing protein